MSQRSKRRIVSKSRFARYLVTKAALAVAGGLAAGIGVLGCVLAFIFMMMSVGGAGASWIGPVLLIFALAAIVLFGYLFLWGLGTLIDADSIEPLTPVTRFNAMDLAQEESLVRASQEPVLEPENSLLRAAEDNRENDRDELLRMTANNEAR
jgi:hypothetical protein